VCRTEARNGIGDADVRDTSPTMGDVNLAAKSREAERRMRVRRDRQNATVDGTRRTSAECHQQQGCPRDVCGGVLVPFTADLLARQPETAYHARGAVAIEQLLASNRLTSVGRMRVRLHRRRLQVIHGSI
jgi:hypothetical protein